jgi:alpha-beta hydrolase superfamily lysophospholipase
MIRRLAFLFLLLGLGALALEQANPLLIYPYDGTEEAPQTQYLPRAEVLELDGPNGKIVVWAQTPKAGKPVVFYLHGNAGNLADRTGRFQRLSKAGFGYFAPAYPGSSGSEGRPSEAALIANARFAYDALQDTARLPEFDHPIVIYGESLGSAVALGLIENFATAPSPKTPQGVVLEAPFASIADMATATVGDIGRVAPFFMDDWPSAQRAAEFLDLPLLVIHGKQDSVVPIAQGQAVFDAAKTDKKRMMRVSNANHVNLWASGALTQVFGHMALQDFGL